MKPFLIRIRYCAILPIALFASALSAEVGDLKAYPNPFSPDKEYLKIARKDNTNIPAGEMKIIVYDFNLKEIYSKQATGNVPTVEWAGTDNTGKKVVPGLYFIKVIHMGTAGGDISDKMLKVLVR